MPDVFDRRKRSDVMARIKSRNAKSTEKYFASLLRSNSIRGWRRHAALPGKPDFYFPVARVAIFVDGCFWHRCPLHFSSPATRRRFWIAKIAGNVQRDRRVAGELRRRGIRVLRVWEHDLVHARETRVLLRVRRALGI